MSLPQKNELNGIKIINKSVTVSTNSDARELILNGGYGDILITADTQTGGRGRQGKSFISPEGGLYMTLAMQCGYPISDAVSVTSCAAVAVCRAMEEVCGIVCGIKWVNDIYLGGGKLAGILVESVNDYSRMISEYLIIGIGINIDHTPEIVDASYNAASLAEHGADVSRDVLCHAIVRHLLGIRENRFDFGRYVDEYRSRSVVLGQEITFTHASRSFSGKAVGIDSRGGLMVDTPEGQITLDSGEISIRLKQNQHDQI